MQRDLHEQNRLSWNAVTPAHNSHKGDQAAFFRAGGDTLFPEELELLGDVEGVDLLHLQCNAGQDTLSLARRGARATGVDISDEAIRFARELSAGSGIAAEFERADVYDWLREAAPDVSSPARMRAVPASHALAITNAPGPWCSSLKRPALSFWDVLMAISRSPIARSRRCRPPDVPVQPGEALRGHAHRVEPWTTTHTTSVRKSAP